MSKINDMLAELCPNGVEFFSLNEIFDLKNGYTPSTKNPEFWTNGTINWFRMDDIRTNGRILSDSIRKVSSKAIKGGRLFEPNSLIVATSATIGEHALITVPFMCNQRFTCLTRKDAFQNRLDMKFVLYYADVLDTFCIRNTNKGGFSSVSMSAFKSFPFPVPPLDIQREIVRVLDSFTKLEAELEAELEARRTQYTYYRDQLLSRENLEKLSDGLVPEIELGKLMAVQRGASPRPIGQYITSDPDGIPWIKIGDVSPKEKYISHTQEKITKSGAEKSRYLEPGSFVLSNSMSFGRPYILQLGGCIHDGWISITHYEKHFSPDFLYHLLNSYPIQKFWDEKASSGTVRNLNSDIVRMTPLLVPPLPVQQRVVDILDRFDALTSSLTDGLPAEIEARRRQYEYYRDRLLDFPRKEADS